MPLARHRTSESAPAESGLGDLLFEMGAAVRFNPGDDIFSQGEAADMIYVLLRGEARLSCFAFGGHHTVDLLNSPGDVFGLEAGPAHEMSAEALSECLVLVASRRGLALMLGEDMFELLESEAARRRLN
jgi:CRP/FNR family nitrogen fixation transcriptional regulator